MDSIGSIIKAVTPPPAGTPDFDRSDDRFDAFLANLHDDLTELRDEATVRAKDRAHAAGEDQARGREVREDAQRLGDLEAEDRAAFARALGRKSADETGTDEPGAGGVAEPEPAAADQPKATIEGEPAAAPVDTDEADATAPAAATATGEVANTLQAPTLDTATLAPTATPPYRHSMHPPRPTSRPSWAMAKRVEIPEIPLTRHSSSPRPLWRRPSTI